MTDTFNLIKEKWIPCVMADGTLSELSLRDTLVQAREIREISDPSPITTASLYRLLLAVLYRVFAPKNMDEWLTIWRSDALDPWVLDNYFQEWGGRFDLLGENYPFYQTCLFNDKTKTKPINDIVPELTQGHTSTLFDHTMDDTCTPVSLSQAARILVTIQSYKLGGLSGLGRNYRDGPAARAITFFLLGENLFRSLLLNLVPASSLGFPTKPDDRPTWEHDIPPEGGTPDGLLDYLTWQTLRIRLSTSPSSSSKPTVSEVTIGLGRDLLQEDLLSPFSRYSKDARRGWRSMRLREDRSLWRDASTLLAVRTSGEDVSHPACLRWAAVLIDAGHLPYGTQYNLVAYGLSANQAKINFWRSERMPIPGEYLADEYLVELLDGVLKRSERVDRDLRNAVTEVALNLVNNRDEAYKIRDHLVASSLYWSSLETPFYELLTEMPAVQEGSIKNWNATLKSLAWDSFETATNGLGRHPRALKATTLGSFSLSHRLAATLSD